MRIIAGESRGRKIKVPRGIRPTQDKVRESIFNILGNRVVDAIILDLFAGSGSFGLEAISRGAKKAIFVEISPKAIKIMRENIDMLGYKEKAKVIHADAIKIIKSLESDTLHPDIIFADPPYNREFVERVLQIIKTKNSSSFLILEHSKKEQTNIGRKLSFGDTEVDIIEFKN